MQKKQKIESNVGQNNSRFLHLFAQFPFNTSEYELDHYHQKVNAQVALWVVELLKTEDLIKLGNFKKIPEMIGFDGDYPAGQKSVSLASNKYI